MQASRFESPCTTLERRSSRRREYWVAVRIIQPAFTSTASSVDVSVGGMRLRPEGLRLRPGQRFELEFDLPMLRQPVRVDVEVRWVDEAADVCGVQFMTGLRAREVWAIQQLVG